MKSLASSLGHRPPPLPANLFGGNRREVYRILQEEGIDLPRYAVLNRDPARPEGEYLALSSPALPGFLWLSLVVCGLDISMYYLSQWAFGYWIKGRVRAMCPWTEPWTSFVDTTIFIYHIDTSISITKIWS